MKTCWYSFWQGVRNLIRYFKIVWNHREWDYGFVLRMLKFQLTDLGNCIANGHEEEKSRDKKVKNIQRVCEILVNIEKDDYLERSGWIPGNVEFVRKDDNIFETKFDNRQSEEEINRIFKKARILEDGEFEEMLELLKGMKGWWD